MLQLTLNLRFFKSFNSTVDLKQFNSFLFVFLQLKESGVGNFFPDSDSDSRLLKFFSPDSSIFFLPTPTPDSSIFFFFRLPTPQNMPRAPDSDSRLQSPEYSY